MTKPNLSKAFQVSIKSIVQTFKRDIPKPCLTDKWRLKLRLTAQKISNTLPKSLAQAGNNNYKIHLTDSRRYLKYSVQNRKDTIATTKISLSQLLVSFALPTNFIVKFISKTSNAKFSQRQQQCLRNIFKLCKINRREVPSTKIKSILA